MPCRAGESANNCLSTTTVVREAPGEASQASLPSILSIRIVSRGNVSGVFKEQEARELIASIVYGKLRFSF